MKCSTILTCLTASFVYGQSTTANYSTTSTTAPPTANGNKYPPTCTNPNTRKELRQMVLKTIKSNLRNI